MKKFLQENRNFLIIAAVITFLSLLRIGNANAQTSQAWQQMTTEQWMADIERQHPKVMQDYKLADGEKILTVCITPEGRYGPKVYYFASRSARFTADENFDMLLDRMNKRGCPATHPHTKIITFQK